MRPTFMGFESARRGLAVNQKGLDIIGNNLSNVYTQGYTRQRVDTLSVHTNIGNTRYAGPKTDFAGQGVTMSGVSQTRDPFLDKRFRDEYADVGYYDQVSTILTDIESAIGVPELDTKTGISNAIKNISDALANFSSNADSKVHANIVATEFKNLTLIMHQLDAKMNNIAEQQKGDLQIATKNVNEILNKLSAINKTISDDVGARADKGEYYGPNELLDERNLLLDELAQYGNINVKSKEDGTVSVTMGGRPVLTGEKIDTLSYRENSDGTVELTWNSDGKRLDNPSGALKGSLDMINGRGTYAQNSAESSVKGIPYYKDKLNIFSNTLVGVFNNIMPELDADGNPVLDANNNPVYRKLLGARTTDNAGNSIISDNIPATAGNISISDEWTADSAYIIYKEGENTSKYAIQLKDALTNSKQNFRFSGVNKNCTFSDFVHDYANECGSEVSFNSGRYEATSAIAGDTLDTRDSVSAVAPDEETTNMMLYNKSYAAISRLMTSLDEALDILINRTGLVGR